MEINRSLLDQIEAAANDPRAILGLLENDGWTRARFLEAAKHVAQDPETKPTANPRPYDRLVLGSSENCEIMLARWTAGVPCAPHDHGRSSGWVFFLSGHFEESSFSWNGEFLRSGATNSHPEGTHVRVDNGDIHSCTWLAKSEGEGLSLHVYFPPITKMRVWDVERHRTLVVADDCGAWIPHDENQVIEAQPWPVRTMSESTRSIVILYTTLYREGGAKFARAAAELARQKRQEFPDRQIVCEPVESKLAFTNKLKDVGLEGREIDELHFIGHSGMYGIMFGTTAWPEQLSPFEWRNLAISFAPGARAYFHACRTGRWFAPFFARTFNVKTYGYFWYTTVSTSRDRFAWDAFARPETPVYIISVPGKKSHGLIGSLQKYALRPVTFPLLEFEPASKAVDTTYDAVAPLYDQTFEDISVRKDELKWLRTRLASVTTSSRKQEPTAKPRVLDIGCGTGSFLRAITDLVETAQGVDLSQGMIEHARQRSADDPKLQFSRIDGPFLPFADASFDAVTSVLSFRYLDWDPIVNEILRVLKPGGRLIVIDMVAAPAKIRHFPQLVRDKMKQQWVEIQNPDYKRALKRMVTDPRWKKMLEYNPIRAEHEMRWYLQSRFPQSRIDVINYGFNSRVLAFESAPVFHKTIDQMSYP